MRRRATAGDFVRSLSRLTLVGWLWPMWMPARRLVVSAVVVPAILARVAVALEAAAVAADGVAAARNGRAFVMGMSGAAAAVIAACLQPTSRSDGRRQPCQQEEHFRHRLAPENSRDSAFERLTVNRRTRFLEANVKSIIAIDFFEQCQKSRCTDRCRRAGVASFPGFLSCGGCPILPGDWQ